MKIPWLPILCAILAVVLVKVVGKYFGTSASLITLGVMLLAWWGGHLFYKRQLRVIQAKLESMDEDRRSAFLAQIDPEIRKDLEHAIAKRKNA